MKKRLSRIFGLVLLCHIVLLVVLLLQAGCQVGSYQITRAEKEETPPATGVAEATAPRELHAPMRPVNEVPDAFNTGLATPTNRFADDDFGALEPLEPIIIDEPTPHASTEETLARYTVRKGDSLYRIARQEGVAFADLLAVNGLDKQSTIYPGQELLLPASTIAAKEEPAPVIVPADDVVGPGVHVVQRGDTLSRIAREYGTTVTALRALNELAGDLIRVGQELVVPDGEVAAASPTPVITPTPTPKAGTPVFSDEDEAFVYEVQPGDSPIRIARQFGVSANALMDRNGIDDARKLRVGQRLVIPMGPVAQAQPLDAPATSTAPVASREESPPPAPARSDEAVTIEPGVPMVEPEGLPADWLGEDEHDDFGAPPVNPVKDEFSTADARRP